MLWPNVLRRNAGTACDRRLTLLSQSSFYIECIVDTVTAGIRAFPKGRAVEWIVVTVASFFFFFFVGKHLGFIKAILIMYEVLFIMGRFI
jgi:hypothetical protein